MGLQVPGNIVIAMNRQSREANQLSEGLVYKREREGCVCVCRHTSIMHRQVNSHAC